MIYDLDKVKEMFAAADEIIRRTPHILQKTTDEIFVELDDGSEEMIHNRWGVMVRAKMQELKSFGYQDIISFLLNIKERNLLSEYIGYVLQHEYKISLLKLLIESYKKGFEREILPFVEQCIEYEEECYIQDIDVILDIIKSDIEQNINYSLAQGYAVVVVRNNSENYILEKYISQYSKELETLVSAVRVVLYRERKVDADKWLEIYLYGDSNWSKTMGIDFLYESLFYDNLNFEKFFMFIEKNFLAQGPLWERVIPVYVQYLLSENSSLYNEKVKGRLIDIKYASQNEKKICLKVLEYQGIDSKDGIEIIEEIINMPFQRDVQVLQSLDYYFSKKFDKDYLEAIERLYKLFEINGYKSKESFLEELPQTCNVINKQQQKLFAFWYDKFINGNEGEFFLSVELFEEVMSVGQMESFLNSRDFVRKHLICLLDGILLFSIDEKKITDLTFAISSCIKDNDFYFSYCIDNIYANYPETLLNVAKNYAQDADDFRRDLALQIVEYDRIYREKMTKGYADRDFMPPMERKLIFQRSQVEKQKEISEMAKQQSFLSHFFSSRTMKYGNKFAFIQTLKKEEMNYQVNGYARHGISKELPRDFFNDPVKYVYLRMDYLRRRDKNATHN